VRLTEGGSISMSNWEVSTGGGKIEGNLPKGKITRGGGEEGEVSKVGSGDFEKLVCFVIDAPDHVGGGVEGASRELASVEGVGVVGSEGVGFGGEGEGARGGDVEDVNVLAVSSETVIGLEVIHFVGLGVVDQRARGLACA
jgi:hypothetical protein